VTVTVTNANATGSGSSKTDIAMDMGISGTVTISCSSSFENLNKTFHRVPNKKNKIIIILKVKPKFLSKTPFYIFPQTCVITH
jgi:hypothetical protein